MKIYFVYILKCNDNSYYIGHTESLEKRLREHNNKTYDDGYTALRLPVKLVFKQEFLTRYEAFVVERQIKKWTRKKKEALINGNFSLLPKLARKQFYEY